MPGKCLYCYNPTGPYEGDMHIACANKVFATYPPPLLPFEAAQINTIAQQQGHTQALFTKPRKPKGQLQARLLPDIKGEYLIKVETNRPYYIPELEHLCLKLAAEAGIAIAENTLLQTADDERVLIIKHTNATPLGDKQTGTYEKLFKAIGSQSSQPGLDKLYMAERLVFSFLIGNSNVHWGNTYFKSLAPLGARDLGSEVKTSPFGGSTSRSEGREDNSPPAKGEYPDTQSSGGGGGYLLQPLVESGSSSLLQPALADDFILSLSGKKSNLNEESFIHFFEKVGINPIAGKNLLRRYSRILRPWFGIIENSFVPDDMKRRFIRLIMQRAERLHML